MKAKSIFKPNVRKDRVSQNHRNHRNHRDSQNPQKVQRGFSLIELLVVVAIIGLLASVTLPALKGIGKSNALVAANRQLLDDLAFARLLAINNRTTVFVALLGPQVSRNRNPNASSPSPLPAINREKLRQLREGIFSGYCIYAKRSVGSQPGRPEPKYLIDWKYLPEGILFDPNKFQNNDPNDRNDPNPDPKDRPHAFWQLAFFLPEPSPGIYTIAFDSKGQLESGQDEWIAFVEGSVEFGRDARGNVLPNSFDVINKTALSGEPIRFIHINWLTGRARAEQKELP